MSFIQFGLKDVFMTLNLEGGHTYMSFTVLDADSDGTLYDKAVGVTTFMYQWMVSGGTTDQHLRCHMVEICIGA